MTTGHVPSNLRYDKLYTAKFSLHELVTYYLTTYQRLDSRKNATS